MHMDSQKSEVKIFTKYEKKGMFQKVIIPQGTVNPNDTVIIEIPRRMQSLPILLAKRKPQHLENLLNEKWNKMELKKYNKEIDNHQAINQSNCIVDGALQNNCIVDGALQNNCIVDGALQNNCIVDGALQNNCIVDGALQNNCIVDGALQTSITELNMSVLLTHS
ncbi:hypothetical protein WA026_007225 [Henosepilachna vigintioctopunctata]|uniref:Uncharacterized protein n=1 Tax=Henosepilachna vigintioctopunctata TaxID=420089 RepID=A0AAW1VD37_9CUCU